MSTTTNIPTLKINYLTQAQYETALNNGEIDENQIYLTPTSSEGGENSDYAITKDTSFAATTWVFEIHKVGSFAIAYLNIELPAITGGATEKTMCDISSACVPTRKYDFICPTQNGQAALIQIYTDGHVSIYSNATINARDFIGGSLVFPINN